MHGQQTTPTDPLYRAKIELTCLVRCFIVTPDNSIGVKVATNMFVLGWVALTVAMGFEDIPTVAPPYYGLYTAVVFLWVGRRWDLEVEKLLPGGE